MDIVTFRTNSSKKIVHLPALRVFTYEEVGSLCRYDEKKGIWSRLQKHGLGRVPSGRDRGLYHSSFYWRSSGKIGATMIPIRLMNQICRYSYCTTETSCKYQCPKTYPAWCTNHLNDSFGKYERPATEEHDRAVIPTNV